MRCFGGTSPKLSRPPPPGTQSNQLLRAQPASQGTCKSFPLGPSHPGCARWVQQGAARFQVLGVPSKRQGGPGTPVLQPLGCIPEHPPRPGLSFPLRTRGDVGAGRCQSRTADCRTPGLRAARPAPRPGVGKRLDAHGTRRRRPALTGLSLQRHHGHQVVGNVKKGVHGCAREGQGEVLPRRPHVDPDQRNSSGGFAARARARARLAEREGGGMPEEPRACALARGNSQGGMGPVMSGA